MTFEKYIEPHLNHDIIIRPKKFRNQELAVPGLYCKPCDKLIKWLSYREYDDLVMMGIGQETESISLL